MNTLRFYGFYIRCVIKAQSEYRVNFISGIFSNIYTYFLTYISVWILTHRFSSIDGWGYNDLILLTGLNLFSYSIAITVLFHYVSGLDQYINENKFDIVLLRPIHPILSMIFDGFAWMGIGQIAISSVFLGYGLTQVSIDWDFYKVMAFLFCLAGGILIQAAALIIFGTLSFWIRKSYSLSVVLYYNLRNFINYPLSIFGTFLKGVLTFILPWAFINYYPALYLLDKGDGADSGYYIFTPILGVLMLAGALWLTGLGIRQYKRIGS